MITTNPVLYEQPQNNQPEAAQAVNLPATLCGAIEAGEDVDYFKFTVTEPRTINFHCWGMRLEDRIHDLQTHVDPIITIRHAATGATVATANNEFAADPFLSHSFQHPGDYLLEVRDVRYGGNKYWEYAIEVSSKPFITQVFPIGLPLTTASHELRPVGLCLPDQPLLTVSLPAEVTAFASRSIPAAIAAESANPVAIVASSLPCITESSDPNNTPDSAQSLQIPCSVNGRIESPRDIDCFQFTAAKGDLVTIEVFARRCQSQLDSIIRILRPDGTPLTENDDLRKWNQVVHQDSEIETWTAPADGNYIIEVRDVHLRGGDAFVYCLKVDRPQPGFDLTLDSDKTWLGPGGCGVIFACHSKKRIRRRNSTAGRRIARWCYSTLWTNSCR